MHVTEGVRAALEKFWADFCLQAVVPSARYQPDGWAGSCGVMMRRCSISTKGLCPKAEMPRVPPYRATLKGAVKTAFVWCQAITRKVSH